MLLSLECTTVWDLLDEAKACLGEYIRTCWPKLENWARNHSLQSSVPMKAHFTRGIRTARETDHEVGGRAGGPVCG